MMLQNQQIHLNKLTYVRLIQFCFIIWAFDFALPPFNSFINKTHNDTTNTELPVLLVHNMMRMCVKWDDEKENKRILNDLIN